MTFDEARAQFPVLERLAYLNAGTNGPLARATADAMIAQTESDAVDGRSGMAYFLGMLELREQVRDALAAVLAVEAPSLALTDSTTRGCAIVLAGLGLTDQDEVVTTDEEHFGLTGPLFATGARVVDETAVAQQ